MTPLRRRNRFASRRQTWPLAALLLLVSITAPATRAHTFDFADVLLVIKSDGSWLADVQVDVDALALGVSPTSDANENVAALQAMSYAELEAAIQRAEETLQRRVRIRFDDEPQPARVEFPDIENETLLQAPAPSLLGLTARFSGRVPEGAEEVSFFTSRALGNTHFTLLHQPTGRTDQYPVEPGARTEPFALTAPGGDDAATGGPSATQVTHRYLVLGFTHILPKGLDHILFVIGLFLISTRWKPLLAQVTAFTLAHTITLALAIFDLVSLPGRIVEPLIALSIAYVAVENLWTDQARPARLALVFGFGLLHGLGFAGVLTELGLPPGRFVNALISFNVGVEVGQLAVIAIALLTVGWFRHKDWYRKAIVIPGSVAIAAVGLYWTIERIVG